MKTCGSAWILFEFGQKQKLEKSEFRAEAGSDAAIPNAQNNDFLASSWSLKAVNNTDWKLWISAVLHH